MSSIGDYLDEQLGRITMYRLVVYGLIAISLMALVLMLTGYLPYSPASFLSSMALFIGVSYATNRLFGWLFGVRPHSESAIITGLILALLFVPPVTIVEGLQLGLVAVIAMASKYVIVFRNRHIFNPAAIGIVIAAMAGLAYAAWWIATPALLPVTVVVSAVILFKTRRLQMAGIFLAVAVGVILMRTVADSGPSLQAVTMAITSWPLVFFAGIMLCEPLTLPPRRRQQFIEAGVVGVLLGSGLHFSIITMTPALALIVGNLLGWYWSTRQIVKLRLVAKKQMGQSMYDFTFDSNKPKFVAGQYLELTLPHRHADSRGMRRLFSIVGRPGDEHINIGTRLPEKPSSFKRALMNLKPGQTVYATRIAGDFVLPDDESVPMLLIAGGIGVTPYISYMMASGKREMSLVYAVSSSEDLAYIEQLRHHDISVTIVSPDEAVLPDPSWRHIKAGLLTQDILQELIGIHRPLVYISGPPVMVNKTKHIVKALGLPYKTDHFAGY